MEPAFVKFRKPQTLADIFGDFMPTSFFIHLFSLWVPIFDSAHLPNLTICRTILNSLLDLIPGFYNSSWFDVSHSLLWGAHPLIVPCLEPPRGASYQGTSYAVSFVTTCLLIFIPSYKPQCNSVWNETIAKILLPFSVLIICNKD